LAGGRNRGPATPTTSGGNHLTAKKFSLVEGAPLYGGGDLHSNFLLVGGVYLSPVELGRLRGDIFYDPLYGHVQPVMLVSLIQCSDAKVY
jgi:hypothetical protein